MYLNYDGAGTKVGDTSVKAQVTDNNRAAAAERVTIYGIAQSDDQNRLWIVAVNKTSERVPAHIAVTHPVSFASASVYQLTAATPRPQATGSVAVSGNALDYELPAMSVTTLVCGIGAPPAPDTTPPARPRGLRLQ